MHLKRLSHRRCEQLAEEIFNKHIFVVVVSHLINAIGSQKLSCLCLFDLSAAFDTTDHNILITPISSWFRIYGSVLNWFISYLSPLSLSNTSLLSIFLLVVFLKALFSVLYSSSCILPEISSPQFLWTVIFPQMILNLFEFFSLSS